MTFAAGPPHALDEVSRAVGSLPRHPKSTCPSCRYFRPCCPAALAQHRAPRTRQRLKRIRRSDAPAPPVETHFRTADSDPKEPIPDNRFPSAASVIRVAFPLFQLNTYMPLSQDNRAWPPLVASAVRFDFTTTSRLLDHVHVPTILPQPPLSSECLADVTFDGFDAERAGEGACGSSLPDTDLSCFPITPPVDPACAKAVCCWPAMKSDNSKAKPVSRPTLHFTGNPPFPPIFSENPLTYCAPLTRCAPSAQTEATTRHALPFLRQSDSALSLAFCISARATIAQLDSE